MKKIPISLFVDDSCPLVHGLFEHDRLPKNERGQNVNILGTTFVDKVPLDFLDRFCDLMRRYNFAGKFTILPAPYAKGDIINGVPGFDLREIRKWIEIAKTRLSGRFDFSPEILTHQNAIDLKSGELLPMSEEEWADAQDRSGLTPYIARALEMLKTAGIDCAGVTSPWTFGINVESEYVAAIAAAQKKVNGRTNSWYFLHCLEDTDPGARPWTALDDGECKLISIPSTIGDFIWGTVNSSRTDNDYINEKADLFISENGRSGAIIKSINAGGWPVICTHWQSYFSNGLETGLKIMDIVGERINTSLGGVVEWTSASEIMDLVN